MVALELLFLPAALLAHPHVSMVLHDFAHPPHASIAFVTLLGANVGAVIMPWMVFYQQSAVADKGLRPEEYAAARWDTAVGALLTQVVMAAVLVVAAATLWAGHLSPPLNTVGQLAQALTPFLGVTLGHTLFGLGMLGAAMVAAIVVALAAAWGFGEVTGYKHSLELHPLEAPWFYLVFSAGVIGGALVVALAPDLVALSVGVEVMNALMLPIVLGFLVALALKALPAEHRLRGWYLWVVLIVVVATSALGVYGGISGAFG